MTKLVLERLEKRFGAVHAIRSLDLAVGEGELVSLLGPSGCGKTTTLRCVAGFEFPDSGRIAFDGVDITDRPPERRDIGMVFQNYALFPHMTVRQNLAFGLEMRRIDRAAASARIERVLAMVQLANMAERYPRQLSGGQQQRVALARALVIEPKLLLLDEPLANLDAALREEMRFFIRDLQRRVGITALYVTHDQAEAMVMSDRIVVMFDGAIAQAAPPAEIYQRPASARIAKFVGRANLIEGTIEAALAGHAHRVATSLGTFAAHHDKGLPVGTDVTVAVRPEAAKLLPDASSDGPSIPVKVEQAYFLGGAVDHVANAGTATFVVTTAPNASFAPGRDAFLTFSESDAWIMAGRL
ncbi:MAG: ABC transporter ATP-binding protein [Rhodospirillaceae bacterium]|nr:ABC transporter ATP-binding protein [Rhodospirillaceae bacterium]